MANKKYDALEILKESVGLNPSVYANDLNASGNVTPEDARIAWRQELGLEPAAEQAGQTETPQTLADQYLNAYKNNQYSYDLYADPVYKQAMESAARQGQLAAKNVQAQAAGLTGGYGNSYGTMAAQQQYNQYLQNANEIVPELEANAYNRYQNEQAKNLTLAQMYLDLENQQYNRQMNEAQLAAQYGDYNGLNGLGINTEKYESREAADNAWTELTRSRQMAEWDQADEDRATNIALQAAQYGDYSKLEKLGFDMSTQQKRDALDEAIQKAQYYDYSGLKALGFDVAYLEAQKAAAWADLYNTGSASKAGSSNSNSKTKTKLTKTERNQRITSFQDSITSPAGYNLTIVNTAQNDDGSVSFTAADANRKLTYITYYPDDDEFEMETTNNRYDPYK